LESLSGMVAVSVGVGEKVAVGVDVGMVAVSVGVGAAQVDGPTWLVSIVTAAFRAIALPDRLALVVKVYFGPRECCPANEVPVPSVAELPTCHPDVATVAIGDNDTRTACGRERAADFGR